MLITVIPSVSTFLMHHSWLSLAVIVFILIVSILLSVWANEQDAALERQRVNKEGDHSDKRIRPH